MFKWENASEEPHNLRWLILIAYLMGLSIGVHLLNLLTIPALAFVYYFKRYTISTKGIIYTAIVGTAILGFIQYGIILEMISLAGTIDLLFVNGLGMPFGTGIVIYGLIIIGFLFWAYRYTRKKNMPVWNTAVLCVSFILIGYSTFAQIVIRSLANPPLDENNPENVFNFKSYLNREQYGDWPLFSGPYYNAPVIDMNISLEKAKEIIDNLFKEFCFKSEQDKINAIAGFITPYLRGLFSSFSVRTPVFIYEANRERAGKDYLAGLTGILYEGFALEEPPISTGDKMQNNSDELRKKILSSMMYGRKRLHFSNNKGYLNNAVFESITTAEKYSDRPLGRSEILTFHNELDFSLSGNIGMTLTPDLANRSRFIKLFLDIETLPAPGEKMELLKTFWEDSP
jgi:hypothetical protein